MRRPPCETTFFSSPGLMTIPAQGDTLQDGQENRQLMWDLIGKLVDIFQSAQCANYFSPCGYDPD